VSITLNIQRVFIIKKRGATAQPPAHGLYN
jgi:hypothetical protein